MQCLSGADLGFLGLDLAEFCKIIPFEGVDQSVFLVLDQLGAADLEFFL